MHPRNLIGIILLASVPCPAQDQPFPVVTGYVTRIASPTNFDVNGRSILLGPKTEIEWEFRIGTAVEYSETKTRDLSLYLGEPIDVYGEIPSKNHAIAATAVRIPQIVPKTVSGRAIIDAALPLPSNSPSTDRLIRADGYPILLTSKTKLAFDKPLSSSSDIHVNVFVDYRGVQRPDGTVVADKATFSKNTISESLDKLREKWEYNPAAAGPDTHQSGIDKAFRGIDPKKFPPRKDPAMQARISAVGARLVPKYQFDFPYTEVTRIDFRFYLIDAPKWRDAAPLPNGIVLVPYQLVNRLQNDSQLAAILADKVACLLEKQPVALPATNGDLARDAAVEAAGAVVPGLELGMTVVSVPASIEAKKQFHLREQQRDRVSLALMHDAGYKIDQAPIAWWILTSKKPKDIAKIPIPRRVEDLYEIIGQTWHAPSPKGSSLTANIAQRAAPKPPPSAPSAPQ